MRHYRINSFNRNIIEATARQHSEVGTIVDKKNKIVSMSTEKMTQYAGIVRELERDGYTVQYR